MKFLFWVAVFAAFVAVYWYGIRPKLRERPELKEYYDQLDPMYTSLWERIRLRLKGWKNFLLGTSLVVVPAITEILDYLRGVDLSGYLTPNVILTITPILGLLVILLRTFTTTAIGAKEPEEP